MVESDPGCVTPGSLDAGPLVPGSFVVIGTGDGAVVVAVESAEEPAVEFVLETAVESAIESALEQPANSATPTTQPVIARRIPIDESFRVRLSRVSAGPGGAVRL